MTELSSILEFTSANYLQILRQIHEHLFLTFLSLSMSIIVAIPAGIYLSRHERLTTPVMGFAGVLQTIPSLAMLGLLLPLVGIGVWPAILALFLYALLPILRNTCTGITGVDATVKEAAYGMGMNSNQVLMQIELPLAMPVIFSGIRTAMVINVGIATLGAFIAAGGLGTFIFRGLSLNNTTMIVAGAIPAAGLALLLDFLLGLVSRNLKFLLKPFIALLLLYLIVSALLPLLKESNSLLRIGVTAEFIERKDGFKPLSKEYNLKARVVELDHGIIYKALHNHDVDAVIGYSTDGEIATYNLKTLQDNRHFFPPYSVAPLARVATLRKFPKVREVLNRLADSMDTETMAALNALVDQQKQSPLSVARQYLKNRGYSYLRKKSNQGPDIIIGSKKFAESIILAEIFALVIENETNLKVETRNGLGGTRIAFEALKRGDIDVYPEYTGTGLLAILKPDPKVLQKLKKNKAATFNYVKKRFKEEFGLTWLNPLGFENTYALIISEKLARNNDLETIEDLIKHFNRKPEK